jgi:O-antigen ligase
MPHPEPVHPAAEAPPELTVLAAGLVLCALAVLPGEYLFLDRAAYPKELVLSASALAAAVACVLRRREVRMDAVDASLAAFLALAVVSALVSAQNSWFALRSLGVTVCAAAVFWTARALAAEGHRRGVLGAACGVVVLVAGTGVAEAYGWVNGWSIPNRAPGGTFAHRNYMAHFLVLGAPALLLAAGRARGRWVAPAYAAVAAVAAAVVLSRSRAAWLAAAVALAAAAVCALAARRPPGRRAALLVGAAAAGVALAVVVPSQLRWKADSPYAETLRGITNFQSGSGHGRLVQYANTLRMAADHPVLGVGAGNWTVHYPRYATPGDSSFNAALWLPTTREPHSDWLAVAAQNGLPALLALLAALGIAAARGWTRARRARTVDEAGAGAALVCTVAALAVVGSLDPVLLQAGPAFLFAALLGALLPPGRAGWSVPLGRGRWAAALVVALACGAPTVYAGRQLMAGLAYGARPTGVSLDRAARLNPGDYRAQMMLAEMWTSRGRCERARPHADAALRLHPNSPAAARLRARCADPDRP